MTDWVDEIFEIIDNTYRDYRIATFICDKCKQGKPVYHSFIIPVSAPNKISRVCEQCYWKIYDELKGE